MEHGIEVINYMIENFLHTWPYLLITIPIAVAVQMSGASKYIRHAFSARPMIAIILATIVGAFSPLCSCSVIPVVAAMLIGGVPLAPVMSFWLASPSMDPEIFFLTVSSLGWNLAVWRLVSTLILSLGGGFITHFLVKRNALGPFILRRTGSTRVRSISQVLKDGLQFIRNWFIILGNPNRGLRTPTLSTDAANCSTTGYGDPGRGNLGRGDPNQPTKQFVMMSTTSPQSRTISGSKQNQASTCDSGESCSRNEKKEEPFWQRLAHNTWDATGMVVKFMLLAWFIGALIHLYIPEKWIIGILGGDNPWSILIAALLGVPAYTSNLTAMPMVGGLLTQGMDPGAALAFLIAGPITTLPAMSAVWGLVNRKVFALYIGFALIGAVALGYVYHIVLNS